MRSNWTYRIARTATLISLLVAVSIGNVVGQSLTPIDTLSLAEQPLEMENYPLRKNGKRDWWEANQTPSTRFRPTQLIVPASLVAIGALGVGEKAPLHGVNVAIREGLCDLSRGRKYHFDDYIQYAPVALYLTLDYMGLEAKHSFGERVAVAGVTYVAVSALSQSIKQRQAERKVAGREYYLEASRRLLCVARLIMSPALLREESRGGHYREDFPCADEAYALHSVQRKGAEITTAPVNSNYFNF